MEKVIRNSPYRLTANGRDIEWFEGLDRTDQTEYLKVTPFSQYWDLPEFNRGEKDVLVKNWLGTTAAQPDSQARAQISDYLTERAKEIHFEITQATKYLNKRWKSVDSKEKQVSIVKGIIKGFRYCIKKVPKHPFSWSLAKNDRHIIQHTYNKVLETNDGTKPMSVVILKSILDTVRNAPLAKRMPEKVEDEKSLKDEKDRFTETIREKHETLKKDDFEKHESPFSINKPS